MGDISSVYDFVAIVDFDCTNFRYRFQQREQKGRIFEHPTQLLQPKQSQL